MDNAISLIRAYLQIHGYFVVTEYPLVELNEEKKMRTVTDIDILAFRFANTGSLITSTKSSQDENQIQVPDNILKPEGHRTDMLIAEVKEGYAKDNRNMFQENALKSVLIRFGCCTPGEFQNFYDIFTQSGIAELPSGHILRSIVFGGKPPTQKKSFVSKFISLKHVHDYLNEYIEKHWDYFKTANFRDPALSFLVTLKKASVARNQ